MPMGKTYPLTFDQVVSTASRLCWSRVSMVSNIRCLSLRTCWIIFLMLASFFSTLNHYVSIWCAPNRKKRTLRACAPTWG